MEKLNIGDKAPQFKAVDQNENEITLNDLLGHKTILFFYPKDNTPGCTAEACNLRDNYDDFKKNGYKIYGVSPDTPKKHQNFITKFDFPFPLISDPEKSLIEAFGVWGLKKFMGREYMGLHRTTFVLDEKGIVTHRIDKVKTKAHSQQLKEELGITA